MGLEYLYASACRLPRYPGIDDGALLVSTPLAVPGIDRAIASSGEFVPSYTVREFPGIESPPCGPLLDHPPWYNTRPRGPPCGSPPWNPWTLLTLQPDRRRPCLVIPGPPGFYIPRAFSWKP